MAQVLPFAAPSCVIPAHVAENAEFLAHKVQEVGLCFFEAKSCLKYGEAELPASLRALPLCWHMHLPVDLPWHSGAKGGAKAAHMALAVAAKAAFLRPRFGVLHPPVARSGEALESARVPELLQDFLEVWQKESSLPVLLENIDQGDLQNFDPELFAPKSARWPKGGYGICLDVGHMLGFGQEGVLQRPDLLRRVQLVHWSAPGKRDEHLPLTRFTAREYDLVHKLVPLLPAQVTHMIEIFRWQGIEESVPVLQRLLSRH